MRVVFGSRRQGEILEEVRRSRESVEDEIRLSREQHADLRLFIRDITLRNERVLGEISERLAELGAGIRANTAATLSVLDRLPGT